MKVKTMRILTIVCTICLLIALAAPAMAAGMYVLKAGTYTLKDKLTVPTFEEVSEDFNFYFRGYYYGEGVLGYSDRFVVEQREVAVVCYHVYNTEPFLEEYANFGNYIAYGAWIDDNGEERYDGWNDYFGSGANIVTLEENANVSGEFYNWFMANVESSTAENTPSLTPPETDITPGYDNMSYYGTVLPNIDKVWTNKTTYPVAVILNTKDTEAYHLIIAQSFEYDYKHINTAATGSPECYCSLSVWQWYDLTDGVWTYQTSGTNNIVCRTANYDLVWASAPVYTDSTRTESFFPTAPTLAGVVTEQTLAGVMTEVVKMIPIGLTCLIGYLALRKGLSIFREVLSRA